MLKNYLFERMSEVRNYTTQMDAARKGIITDEMKAVEKKEYRTEEEICELVAKKIRDNRKPEIDESCSMCGKFCAVRSMNKALNGEHIDIL